MNTVSISLDTARHAVTCIQARASEGIQLALEAAADQDLSNAAPHVKASFSEAMSILRDLEAAQVELLAAIDSVGAEE